MSKRYLDKLKQKVSHEDVMKDVFKPLSKTEQELLIKNQGAFILPEIGLTELIGKSPEWGMRHRKTKPIPEEKFIPNSALTKETEVIGPKTPSAQAYLEYLSDKYNKEDLAKSDNLQEVIDYYELPQEPALSKEQLKEPKWKESLTEDYNQYKELKTLMQDFGSKMPPEIQQRAIEKIKELEHYLVRTGKLGKA